MAKHGFRFGFQAVSETTPSQRGMTIALCTLALIAVALLWVPWNNIFPPAAPVTVAHVQPAPSPVSVVQVSGAAGSVVCVLPTGKPARVLKLVKVP